MKQYIAALVAGVTLAASGAALAQQKLKFAHVYETSEPYHTAAVWAAGEIKKRTNGRYDVEVFPASSLGKETVRPPAWPRPTIVTLCTSSVCSR